MTNRLLSFKATRINIESFAHIILGGNPKQRNFWLGKGTLTQEQIERTYGFLKPCLHGSDAHMEEEVGKPVFDRFCWIKGDLSFETLRQTVIEPEERVWIGQNKPKVGIASYVIDKIIPSGTSWLKHDILELNPGFIAIIGARGSGKTALVDLIAAGTQSISPLHLNESSFLVRASSSGHLSEAKVELVWGDNTKTEAMPIDINKLTEIMELDRPDARYLSQHFVERLCSVSGLAYELREEIERVVFESIDMTDRLEADNFEQLTNQLLYPIRSRQDQLREQIAKYSERVANEDINKRKLPSLKQQYDTLTIQLTKLNKELTVLVPKGKEKHVKKLSNILIKYRVVEEILERLKLQIQKLKDLKQHVSDISNYIEPYRWKDLLESYSVVPLTPDQWSPFKMDFKGDVDSIIDDTSNLLQKKISNVRDGDPNNLLDVSKEPTDKWPLVELAKKLEDAKKGLYPSSATIYYSFKSNGTVF